MNTRISIALGVLVGFGLGAITESLEALNSGTTVRTTRRRSGSANSTRRSADMPSRASRTAGPPSRVE